MGKFIYLIPLALIQRVVADCVDSQAGNRVTGELFLDPSDSCKGCECLDDTNVRCTEICNDSAGCPDIRFSVDFEWGEVDTARDFAFTRNCGHEGAQGSSGQKCRISPKAPGDGGQCHQGAKGSIFFRKNPDIPEQNLVIRSKSFVCRLDTDTNRFRWARRSLKKSEAALRTVSKVGFADEWKAECGEPDTGCAHPKTLFNDALVSLTGHTGRKHGALGDLDDVNINFGRKGKWVCRDRSGAHVMGDTIPRLSTCEITCANTFVPPVGRKLKCKDHKNIGANKDNPMNDFQGMVAVYRSLHKRRYQEKAEFANMAINNNRDHGWKCYTTQPVYGDFGPYGPCVDGKRTRIRPCEGTCDDTEETDDC